MLRCRLRQWVQSWPDHSLYITSSVCGLGFIANAPGTWGSLAGLILYLVLLGHLPIWLYTLLVLGLLYFAVVVATEVENRLQEHDPASVVIDECMALPLCFWGIEHASWLLILIGFVLFRFFDITKVLGIRKFQELDSGWGVVMDDVMAAIYTNVILRILLIQQVL